MTRFTRSARRNLYAGSSATPASDTAAPAASRTSSSGGALTVSQLSARITRLLEEGIGRVRVEGEISNLRIPSSGHAYFVLKDDEAAINAVCFRSSIVRMKVQLRDGLQVAVTGRLTAWAPRSQYQIIVESASEAGLGDLMRRFIELRDRLQAEGVFDADRKRPLPRLPGRIGVVTSATGAAVRDILNVLRRRAGGLEVFIAPCAVQGEAAPGEIIRALKLIERHGRAEAVIVGRGGGSIEDLWAFNDERVVRAVAACPIPVISAVGHETDTTLTDFAADLRAPTPSAAAEIVTANYEETRQRLGALSHRMLRVMAAAEQARRAELVRLTGSWGLRRPLDQLRHAMQRTDDLTERLARATPRRLAAARRELGSVTGRLASLAPRRRIEHRRERVAQLGTRLLAVRPDRIFAPKIDAGRQKKGQLELRLVRAARERIGMRRIHLAGLAARLEALGYPSVLRRGFSIVTTANGRTIITSPEQVREGQALRIRSAGGEWRAAVLRSGSDMFDEADDS